MTTTSTESQVAQLIARRDELIPHADDGVCLSELTSIVAQLKQIQHGQTTLRIAA